MKRIKPLMIATMLILSVALYHTGPDRGHERHVERGDDS
jgi:hypothetical protein